MSHSNPPRLFMCHSTSDKSFVQWLADQLASAGIRIWLDKWEVRVGDSIIAKINEGISASDYLLIVLSARSVESPWVREELNSGILRNIESQGAFVLPVLIEDCQVPPLLAHRRYADFRHDKKLGLSELLDAIRPRDEQLLTELGEQLARFDALAAEMVSISASAGSLESLLRHILELNLIMEKSVHLRFTREADAALFDGGRLRWNVFYDELDFLRIKGLDLMGNPTWGRLRNIRNHWVHPGTFERVEEVMEDIEALVRELDVLREVLIKLMRFDDG